MPSSPSSSTINININNYPIGLIHLTCISPSSSPSDQPFTLTSINTFALSLLHLPSNPSFTLFKQSILSYHSSSLTDNNTSETMYTLYDVIVSSKPFLCSNFVHSTSNQIIHVKLKRIEHSIHIVIDDYDDNRANIQEKIISSIPKQHLITISHELKNYFCGVLTSLEDSKTNLEETQLLYLSSCIDLIKKFIKIFILYVQVCLDNNSIHSNSKVFSNLDFFSTFNNAFDKARVIYKYKHINVDLSKNTPSFQVNTEFHYFKNFIKNVFIYMYYISPNNAQIVISVTKNQMNEVIFECAFAHNQQSQGLFVKQGAYKMLDTSDKMNDPDVKQSVLTVPLLEYILEKLAKCLNIDIQFKKNINNNNSCNSSSSKDVFLHIVFHKVIFDDAYFNTNNILLVTACNQQNNALWRLNNVCNSNNNNNSGNSDNNNNNKENDNKGSVIMFPYERKNTMERARMSMDNVRHGLHGNSKLAMSIEPISSSKFNGLSTRGKFGNGVAKSSFCEWDKDNSQVNISNNNSNIKINNSINNNNNSNTSNNNNHIQQNSLFSKNKMKSSNNFRKFNLSIDSSENDNNNNNNNQFHSLHNKLQDDSLNQDNNTNNNNNNNNTNNSNNNNNNNNNNSNSNTYNNNNKADTTNSNDYNSQSNTLILGTLYQGLPGTNGTVNPSITTSIRKRIHLIEEYSNIKLKNYLRPPPCECKDIALVDDENFIINSVSSMIRSQKLKCDCFSDGKYCYEKILEKTKCNCKRKYYKLILMDIYMHEWSGIKTCEKIGELIEQDIIPKTINVVLISAHKEKDLNLPNYDFIKGFYQKPVCKKTIVSILNEFYL